MADRYTLLVAQDYTEEQFRVLWHDNYVRQEIFTFDDIRVHFYDDNFDHAFYESTKRNVGKGDAFYKNELSKRRLARMMWIKDTLQDEEAKIVIGYDKKTQSYKRNKRVSIVKGNYVVVIQLYGDFKNAKFITAYVADNSIDKIMHSPEWK